MKKQLIATMTALLVLSGCGTATEQKTEIEIPTVENTKEMLTTYFEDKGYEVIAEENVAKFAYWLTVNSWDLPGGSISISIRANDDDPSLLGNFSVNVIRYASKETFKSTDVLCERFKIDEMYCDFIRMFVPSIEYRLTPELPSSMMQSIIDKIDPSSPAQRYTSSYFSECPFASYFSYGELTPSKTDWILDFTFRFDDIGCSEKQD